MIVLDLEDMITVYGYTQEVLNNEGKVAYLEEKKELASKGIIPFYGYLDLENQKNLNILLARKLGTAVARSNNEELPAVVRSCFSQNAEELLALITLLKEVA